MVGMINGRDDQLGAEINQSTNNHFPNFQATRVHSLLVKQQMGIPVMIKLSNYVGLKKRVFKAFFYTPWIMHFTEYCSTIFMEHVQCKMS